MTLELVSDKEIDAILGTPSAQTILRLLSIWDQLPLKEVQNKSELSESQVHATLKRLVDIHILHKVTKGLYSYSPDNFASLLKEAYKEKNIHHVNTRLTHINSLLKENKIEEAQQAYQNLITGYEPMLDTYFSHLMSALTHSFLEHYEKR